MKGVDNLKRILCIFLIILTVVFFSIPTFAASGESYSWYCAHRKDHLQPRADSNMTFIEKYNGFYIDSKHGNNNSDKVIYLTFDAGYENGNVQTILDILNEENVEGAFFVLGHLIEENTDLVKSMFENGHLVCNHTYSHKTMVGKTREEFKAELERLEQACLEKTGYELDKFYRPPEGRFDECSLVFANEMGYKTIFWSFGYDDWDNNKQKDPQTAKKKILDNVHNGEIMLLHPTSSTNAQVLRDVIVELKNAGYRFGSLKELG